MNKRFLNTCEAARYLESEHNVRRAPSTLVQLRHHGKGPSFRGVGRDVVYEPIALDAFAQSLISPELHSTAETRAA